jgi:hypothetical protein
VLPDTSRVVSILADILPACAQDDFDTEKSVIIGEIAAEDNPSGQPTTARSASTSPTTTGQQHPQYARASRWRTGMILPSAARYAATGITVVAAGQFDWDHLVGLVTGGIRAGVLRRWDATAFGRRSVRVGWIVVRSVQQGPCSCCRRGRRWTRRT